jgi:hypothetical protein
LEGEGKGEVEPSIKLIPPLRRVFTLRQTKQNPDYILKYSASIKVHPEF